MRGAGAHVLLGHSMGGLIASRFAAEGLAVRPARWWRPVDALVLSSPALVVGLNVLEKALPGVLNVVAPDGAIPNPLDPKWISRDPAVVQGYLTDPLIHRRITARLARFISGSGDHVLSRAPQWRLPTLLMWAGADRLADPTGSRAFAAAAPPEALVAREFPQLFHEIFNEPKREQVIAQLTLWLSGLKPRGCGTDRRRPDDPITG